MLRNLNVLFVLLLIAGCAELGLAPADTFDKKLAYAYGVHTAVVKATTSALDAKTLKSTDAEQVASLSAQSRTLLDGALAASKTGDITTANGKLLLATNILEQLQAYLRSKQNGS